MSRYNLAGRTVAITGGTGGLARALAPALLTRGAHVALLDIDADMAAQTAAQFGPPNRICGIGADVRSSSQLEDAMARAADTYGRLDVVLANAGVGETGGVLAHDDVEQWETMIDINLNGVYRTFRAAQPHVARTRGYMLATSSMAAFVHSPLQGGYPASKAGVWALCDTWRLETRHDGIAVGSLHPTFFRTPMMEAVWENPAIDRLWHGNTRGLWKQADIDTVVADTARGIERRAARIVSPRRLSFAAAAPGVAQALIERFGFPGSTIEDSVTLAKRSEIRALPG
ncbi:SDR family NAD(P)-dependent oxidoreductase [Rhodococcus sp. NPDC057297]|uniref:SDR family NAD(P)-dependent oxidoreductase n=1 Tax=Rhodococcus sp. NPDC057297 TaxID=3346090 RepID=UPI003625C787